MIDLFISVDETIQTDIKIYRQTDESVWNPPLHSHNHYEIQYILEGEADFVIEGKAYRLLPGNLVVINRLEKHDIHVTKYPYSRYCLSLKQEYCMRTIKDNLLLSILFQRPEGFKHVIPIDKQEEHLFISIFDALINETADEKTYSEIMIKCLVNMFLVTLYRQRKEYFPLQPEIDTSNVILDIQRHINLNYMHQISLDGLAEKFFISKFNICRNFKTITGYSVKDYIVRQRMAHAKALLANTDLSVVEIAEQCGYQNIKQFYRIFKEREEISPVAFREIQSKLKNGVR